MNSTQQALWAFLTLVLLACSGWYFANAKPHSNLDPQALTRLEDTRAKQVSVKQFNTEGLLINHLKSPLMQHVPLQDTYTFKNPAITITQGDEPAWTIHAQKAQTFDSGQRIQFTKQVVVHQNAGKEVIESTLKTEEVTYFPKEKKATTSLLVTFEQPGNFIQSTGMNAYLDEKRVELLHAAKGLYAPAKG